MFLRNPLCLTVVLAALFNVVPFRSCLLTKDALNNLEVPGFQYLGSYQTHHQNLKGFSDSDYYVSIGAASWNVAETDCKSRFGSDEYEAGLLWLNEPKELEYVAEMLTNRFPGPLGHWTSGIYVESRDTWIWSTNREDVPSWLPWTGGAPPNNPDSTSRMVLSVYNEFDVSVNVETANTVKLYICKRSSVASPTTTTEDTVTEETTTEVATGPTTTTRKPVPVVPCYKTLDLELVLDSSGSVGSDNFLLALEYFANLTSAFTVHNESRVGYITFSTSVTRYIPLTNTLSPQEIMETIQATTYNGGGTNTHLAVDNAAASLQANERPSIARAMVVVTDGASNDPALTSAAALRARNLFIDMYAVGITSAPNEAELLKLAGNVPANVFHAYNWDDLIPLLTETSDHICPT